MSNTTLSVSERLAKVDEIRSSAKSSGPTEVSDELFAELACAGSVSNRIRLLHRKGWTTSNIAKVLEKRYQHVRNVLKADEERALIKRMQAEKAQARS